MYKLFKSFYNLTFFKWLQSIAFILFIFLFSGLTAGIVSTPLQIIGVTSRVGHEQTRWDYSWKPRLTDFSDEYLYRYFESKETKDGEDVYKNSLNESLLDWTYVYKGLVLDDYFKQYYKETNGIADDKIDDVYKINRPNFLGNFIKNNLYAYGNLYNRLVYLYPVKGQESSAKTNYVSLDELLTPQWNEYSKQNYDQVYKKVVEDLPMVLNLSDVTIDCNFTMNYSWAKIGQNETEYDLEPLNLGKTNNVVVFKSNLKNLAEMKNDEVLINNKYAEKNRLKIGDYINLNNFGDETIHQKYKIVGFGNKINNVFLDNQLSNEYDKINNSVYVYLNEDEMQNYISFFYKNSNYIEAPLRKDPVHGDVYTTTRISTQNSTKNFQAFTDVLTSNRVLTGPIKVNKYSDLTFVKTIELYVTEAVIFIVIGLILLLLSTGFINYCLKKELDQSAPQIGVLKANGCASEKIAFIFWTRVLILMIVGFGLGFAMSLPIQALVHNIMVVNCFVVIQTYLFNPWFVVTIVLVIPLLLSLVSFLILNNYLKKSSLELTNFKSVQSAKNKKFNSFAAIFPSRLAKNRLIIKDALKTILITFLLVLANLTVLLEFNAKTFTNNLIDNWSTVYDKKTNSSFDNGYQFNWRVEKTFESYYFEKSNLYNMDYINYTTTDDLKKKANNSQSVVIKQEIDDYLNADRNKETANWSLIAAQLNKIYNEDVNHVAIDLTTLKKLLVQGVSDYHQISDDERCQGLFFDKSKTDEIVKNIETNWIPNFNLLANSLLEPNPLITLNNTFLHEKNDFPILKLDLSSLDYYFKSNENWKLYLLDDQNYEVFNLAGKQEDNLKKLKDANGEGELPVIVSNRFAKLNKVKLNKIFQVSLSKDDYNVLVPLRIVGINKKDNYSNNFYAESITFVQNFLKRVPVSPFYNEVFTKRQFLHFDKDNSIASAKMETDYFNFFYPAEKDAVVPLSEIVLNFNSAYSYVNWFNLSTSNFLPIDLSRRLAQQKVHEFYSLINLIILATVVVVLVLYLVFVLVNINEKKKLISTFKALGYSNFEINRSILGKYFTSELVAIAIGLGISYLMWWLAVKALFIEADVVINNPFNWITFTVVLVIMMLVLLVGATASHGLIKNIFSKNEED